MRFSMEPITEGGIGEFKNSDIVKRVYLGGLTSYQGDDRQKEEF